MGAVILAPVAVTVGCATAGPPEVPGAPGVPPLVPEIAPPPVEPPRVAAVGVSADPPAPDMALGTWPPAVPPCTEVDPTCCATGTVVPLPEATSARARGMPTYQARN